MRIDFANGMIVETPKSSQDAIQGYLYILAVGWELILPLADSLSMFFKQPLWKILLQVDCLNGLQGNTLHQIKGRTNNLKLWLQVHWLRAYLHTCCWDRALAGGHRHSCHVYLQIHDASQLKPFSAAELQVCLSVIWWMSSLKRHSPICLWYPWALFLPLWVVGQLHAFCVPPNGEQPFWWW